jgi:hypothetical protein
VKIDLERITPRAPTRPNEKVTVLWHHTHVAWRADKIAIVESLAERWNVNDIRVHGRSQFAPPGPTRSGASCSGRPPSRATSRSRPSRRG